MPLYEVELRGDSVEHRLTDHPLEVGASLRIGAREWVVAEATAARDIAVALRYVCVRTREEAQALRGQAEVVKTRSERRRTTPRQSP
jgi:hypothetical protein